MAENNDIQGVQEQGRGEAGRDSRGRFIKGNSGGPGNPFARQTARLRQVMLDEVSEDDLRDIVKTVKQCAREGDMAAAKMVFSYCIGRPAQAVDPDRLDIEEVKHFQEQACDAAALSTVLRGVPAAVACFLLESGIDAVGRKITDGFFEQFRERFPDEAAPAAQPEEPEPARAESEAVKVKEETPDQGRPAESDTLGRQKAKPPKRPAAPNAKLLPLEEIVNAPR